MALSLILTSIPVYKQGNANNLYLPADSIFITFDAKYELAQFGCRVQNSVAITQFTATPAPPPPGTGTDQVGRV
jgi:hypothetical protein